MSYKADSGCNLFCDTNLQLLKYEWIYYCCITRKEYRWRGKMVRPPNLISEDSKTFFQTKLEPITACHPAQKHMSIIIPVNSE